MKYFLIILLIILFTLPSFSQYFIMPANDIERSIMGDSLAFVPGKSTPNVQPGYADNQEKLTQLIFNLKEEAKIGFKGHNNADSLLMAVYYKIFIANWMTSMYDPSKFYKDEQLIYALKALSLARQAHLPGEITSVLFNKVIGLTPENTEKIRLTKEWKKEYHSWLYSTTKDLYDLSPNLLLANIYSQAGASNLMLNELEELLHSYPTLAHKLAALDRLISHYYELDEGEKYVPYCFEFLKENTEPATDLVTAVFKGMKYQMLVRYYLTTNKPDSAALYLEQIMPSYHCINCVNPKFWSSMYNLYKSWLAILNDQMGEAKEYFVKIDLKSFSSKILFEFLPLYYKKTNDPQGAFNYITQAHLEIINFNNRYIKNLRQRANSAMELATAYETSLINEQATLNQRLLAQKYQAIESENTLKLQNAQIANKLLEAEAQNAEKQKEQEIKELENKANAEALQKAYEIKLLNESVRGAVKLRNFVLAALGVLFIFSVFIYRQFLNRRKLSKQLETQNSEITVKQNELAQTLNNLRATQNQLIHAEKMASLGELTAGIAHEIQNPLNFVNNFSDINKELFDELEVEIEKGDKKEIAALIRDLRENEAKIMLHGKRADGIVKSMLQHSRTTSAAKELTDINALCDEYLCLAYHGMRAKDKSFAVDYKTELDPHLPKVNVMAQDIGRVLLNLINNAFQAVDERSKKEVANFQPQVTVRTHKLPDAVKIVVEDNGTGIPEHVKGKIFQPFFTTKPTGQGTGLGLSLSYDIISKGHGGELSLETVEGQGTTFIVRLPLK